MIRWRWRRWRARHYELVASWAWQQDPSEANRAALERAQDYYDRIEAGRP